MSDQAMKLFEALSDVDEELLERCNCETGGEIAHMPLWKYGKVMAACLCLLVVGALSFSKYQLLGGRNGSAGSGSNTSAPAQIQDMATPMESWAGAADGDAEAVSQITEPEEAETAGIGNVQSQTTNADDGRDDNTVNSPSNDSKDQNRNNAGSSIEDSLFSSSVGNSIKDDFDGSISEYDTGEKAQAQKEPESASAYVDSRAEISWNTACKTEPFGSYLPTAIPEGYEQLSVRQSSMPDEWNNMIFKWGNGEQVLYLNMTVREAKTKDEVKAEIQKNDGLNQYLAEEFKREMIPDSINGEIWFTLYYSDGMKIDFSGNITEDEMWELVNSIQK